MDVTVLLSKKQLDQMRNMLLTNRDPNTCAFTSVHWNDAVARPIQRPAPYYKCSEYLRLCVSARSSTLTRIIENLQHGIITWETRSDLFVVMRGAKMHSARI